MEYRKLGKFKLKVSAIGLGCWGMSDAYGKSDPAKAIAAIHGAMDLGINFFDTADIYGGGGNEKLLGRALQGKRQRAVIATKFGFVGNEHGSPGVNCRPEYVKKACDRSLKRLGTDYIDLYFQHRQDPKIPVEETMGAVSDLAQAGKILCAGLSEASADTLKQANNIFPITALQSEYSLFSRGVEEKILPLCQDLDIGFVPFSPLGRGVLTGLITKETQFEKDDYRTSLPRFQGENLSKNLDLLLSIQGLARDKNASFSQIALAWLLSRGEYIVPIPGMKTNTYLKENIQSINLHLSAHEIELLDSLGQKVQGQRHNSSNLKFVKS
jgi:aryl-alcohol dehydrogenase-like predicted oxidoreductase